MVYEIMEESFPQEEYRPYGDQLALWDREEYKVYGIVEGKGSLEGFLAVWELPGWVFIEHFAVRGTARNKGLGSYMLRQLHGRYLVPMCLEVELPTDPLTIRRVGFYERNGFYCNGFPYEQPSLGEGRNPVPLRIMSTGDYLTSEGFSELKNILYRTVYGCDG